jgi:hypothetical protein
LKLNVFFQQRCKEKIEPDAHQNKNMSQSRLNRRGRPANTALPGKSGTGDPAGASKTMALQNSGDGAFSHRGQV